MSDASSSVVPAAWEAPPYGFDVLWQDFRNWTSRDKPPTLHRQHFATRTEAEAHKALVRDADEIVACVVATTPPVATEPKQGKRRQSHLTR